MPDIFQRTDSGRRKEAIDRRNQIAKLQADNDALSRANDYLTAEAELLRAHLESLREETRTLRLKAELVVARGK